MGPRVVALSSFSWPGDLVIATLRGGQLTLSCVLYKELKASARVMSCVELNSVGDLSRRTESSATP